MAKLNPDHLLDQAFKLIQPTSAGKPRQVDLRRGISAAYYAVFHELVNSVANEVVGAVHHGTREYALVVRQPDHRSIKELCLDLSKATPPAKLQPYLPAGGFGPQIASVAAAFPDLQQRRHDADYNPLPRFRYSDAAAEVANAQAVIGALRQAPPAERKALFYLILFSPKRG